MYYNIYIQLGIDKHMIPRYSMRIYDVMVDSVERYGICVDDDQYFV